MIIDTFDMSGCKTYLVATENMSYLGGGGGSYVPPVPGTIITNVLEDPIQNIIQDVM